MIIPIARWMAAFLLSTGALMAHDVVLFEENFEGGNLDAWVGDVHGPHAGSIVSDPLRPRNHVLTFTALGANGNLFSAAPILVTNNFRYAVTFEYLGAAHEGSITGNLGGFLGLAASIDDWQTGRFWIAGTDSSGLSTSNGVKLIDDGAWHSYEIDVTSLVRHEGLSELHLMIEDWRDIGGVPGDAFFDNIRFIRKEARAPHLQMYVTEITVCWDSEINQTYKLQYRSSGTPGGWTDAGTPIAGTGETICVADHLPPGEPQRFYRVAIVP
jgi:hypothetical protein